MNKENLTLVAALVALLAAFYLYNELQKIKKQPVKKPLAVVPAQQPVAVVPAPPVTEAEHED